MTAKKLVNEYSLNEKMRSLATKEEIKTLATNGELKVEQDKIVKLQISGLLVKATLSMMEHNFT